MDPIKLFISYASEDQDDCARPLAEALRDAGYAVWYAAWSLTIGDSLLQKISRGLREANFGVVILSRHFFAKNWPQAELDGLYALEDTQRKVILPVWKDISAEEIKAVSPILGIRLGAPASKGIPYLVEEINRAVQVAQKVESFSAIENAASKFRILDQQLTGAKQAQQLSMSEEGVQLAQRAAEAICDTIKGNVAAIQQASTSLQFEIEPTKRGPENLKVWCQPYRLCLSIGYHCKYSNSLSEAEWYGYFVHPKEFETIDLRSDRQVVKKHDFRPTFDDAAKLCWKSPEKRS